MSYAFVLLMIPLKIYGQTPSKKSSQIMVLAKPKKMTDEWYGEKCGEVIMLSHDGKILDVANFLREFIKDIPRGRPILLPNKKYLEWEKQAIFQLKKQKKELGLRTIEGEVEVKSMIYRYTKRRMDLLNPQQSIHDVLEAAGIVRNDFQIKSTDGSRLILGVEKGQERVEIFLKIKDPF